MRAAIIIPALNEAKTIASVVARVKPYGMAIVVDDGSRDETSERATAAGAVVVRHDVNRGYDGALASGFAKAEEIGAEAVVSFDADGQLDAAALPPAVAALADGRTELVLGRRRTGGARLSERLFNLYSRTRFGVPDILCGLKGFRIAAYARHRERVANGNVNTALALALLREGAAFRLVEVATKPRDGRPRFGGMIKANLKIFAALANGLKEDALRR
jgi:glycosyltransferase involved in cell wall biosynthesis